VGPRGAIRRVARGDSQTLGFVDAGYFFRAELSGRSVWGVEPKV